MYAGERAVLRPFGEAHMRRTLEWVNDPLVAFTLGRCRPVTSLEHERWYEQVVRDPRNVLFAIEATTSGEHVGNIWLWGIHPENRSAELRVLVGSAAHRGRGLGSEAVQLLLDVAFRRLNLHKVFLYVLASNLAAQRAFERGGFAVEGTLRDEMFVDGRYVDVLRMGVLCSDPRQVLPQPAAGEPPTAATRPSSHGEG